VGNGLPHISVCICTYKRPLLLKRTVESVSSQLVGGIFTFSIVVADNDKAESARTVVEEVASRVPIDVKYCVEPQQNIAMARNKAVENAKGDFIAFIDDDEFLANDWLVPLFKTLKEFNADGVLGPVNPYFDTGAPNWVIKGGFYDRPIHPTGMTLQWRNCRTGNVLLKRALFSGDSRPFKPECLSGEDQDFFRRKIEEGKSFVWCHEAAVLEVVPAVRWKRSFLLRRALFRGVFAQRNHGLQPLRVLQALISTPLYAVMLPVALALGQATFMKCLFKLSYHTGRLFALFGFNPISQPYVYD
jgi:glycosyltransferase involved in cell wall biosynthesis